MLILVVSLSVGALTYRAYTRNIQVITSNQQRVIYNAATPAIDRARSKLEFMFDSSQDNRYPSGGVPDETRLANMMLNDGIDLQKLSIQGETGATANPYLLPGETPRDLPNTPGKDNAWSFRADTDGNGVEDATVVYSIIFRTPTPPPVAGQSVDQAESQRLLVKLSDKEKSNQGIVRHGPLTTETGSACQLPSTAATAPTSVGWFNDPTNTSIVRKNFQVDVLVVPDSPKSVATTIEFHQDREISKGNKWAAWFRDDLEVFPGPDFRFNGAIHTEGNLIVGGSDGQKDRFQSYLISSKNSCLYPPIDNSEISITTGSDEDKFQGVIAAGGMGFSTDAGGFKPHYQQAGQPKTDIIIDKSNDTNKAAKPEDVYSDPVAILTEDKRQTKKDATGSGANPKNNSLNYQAPTYNDALKQRIQFKKEQTPYIDDLSRADGRWGPKSTYPLPTATSGSSGTQQSSQVPARNDGAKTGYGYKIPPDQKYLTTENSLIPKSDAKDLTDENVGADGYWDGRARNEGLRILVGERLELGNPFGWVTPRDGNNDGYISSDPTGINEREGDPLYPPEVKPYPVASASATVSHIQQQHRTLRDNLAAVQATALYHTDFINNPAIGADYPFACLATTAHPGTPTTLRQSTNFVPTRFNTSATESVDLLSDFFSGRGTNGWEFEPPAGNLSAFKTAIGSGQPLGIALRNLAHFAGDPDGAFPPKQDNVMHPYPALSMWGNFSNLRRALDLIDSGTSYDSLSSADKTYIQTASCTVGMLAYEIDTVQKFDPTKPINNIGGGLGLNNTRQNGRLMLQLGADLYDLMNESATETNRVLPKALIKQFQYNSTSTTRDALNPRDYYSVPPEAYIEALRQQYSNINPTDRGYGVEAVNNSKLRMAELIMLNFQIRRDRTFGFRPSPSFGHYAIQLPSRGSSSELAVYPSACDPDLFAIDDGTLQGDDATNGPKVSVNDDGTPKAIADFAPSPGLDAVKEQKLVRARLGLSRLCGALNIPAISSPPLPTDYDLSKAYSISDENQQRPVVMPKFPALYYIFPQEIHDLNGTLTSAVDIRQPGSYAVVDGTPAQKKLGLKSTDKESYIADSYVQSSLGSYKFQPVQSVVANQASPSFTGTFVNAAVPTSIPNSGAVPATARFPDENRQVFPTKDFKVDNVVIQPRSLPGFSLKVKGSPGEWLLPSSDNVTGAGDGNANIPTNIIEAPTFLATALVNKPFAVPFLDRAFFDARQLMVARTLDLDVGMMRSDKAKLKGGQRGEPLMPMSGIVYAFREDAVREDAIARPAAGTATDATKPATPTDPPLQSNGSSIKSVDGLPDPNRRINGFRLRNGRQVKRDKSYESGVFEAADNYRGLSLFTDQPLYIQGDLNRHQTGSDDTIGEPLEEFTGGTNALIRGKPFDENKFYNRGGGGDSGKKDDRFASLKDDRWRPTELLADSISILSDNFCDGSISDMFVGYEDSDADKGYQRHPGKRKPMDVSQRSIYHDADKGFKETGLYGLGCVSDNKGFTSFQNSDLPISPLSTVTAKTGRYDWLRENPNVTSYNALAASSYEGVTMPAGDYATPIKISRSGLPLLSQPSGLLSTTAYAASEIDQKRLAVGTTYAYADQASTDSNVKGMKFGKIGIKDDSRKRMKASSLRPDDATNVNSIVVSGIVPSQPKSSYGGLHNFPRFIEDWQNVTLDYVGSFLQLSFSNYSTAPYQMVALDRDSSGALTPPFEPDGSKEQNIGYYEPPLRQWGYDVALQLAPAGPAASRFVLVKTPRNEFYTEPQINDPYIQNLCEVAKSDIPAFPGAKDPNLNCK